MFLLGCLDWLKVELVKGSLRVLLAGVVCTGTKYLLIELYLGGGGGSGGGGGWFLLLPEAMLGNIGNGFMGMFVLIQSLTPALNFSSFVSFFKDSSNLL